MRAVRRGMGGKPLGWNSVDRWLGRRWFVLLVVLVVDIIILSLRLPRGAWSAEMFLGNFNDSLADGNPFDSSALAI